MQDKYAYSENNVFTSITILSLLIAQTSCYNYTEMAGLITSLLGPASGYDVNMRPIINQSATMPIEAVISLVSLSKLDAVDQTIELNLYLQFEWEDQLLTWTPASHNNIQYISPASNTVWMPSCHLANSLAGNPVNLVDLSNPFPITVTFEGEVTWSPPMQLHTTCQLDMTKFPNDHHTCRFYIYVNGYNQDEVRWDVESQPDKFSENLRNWIDDGQWEIVNYTLASEPRTFLDATKSCLVLDITFRRLPMYFLLNILVPTIALSFLNILVFVLPVSSGEQVSFSITVLLSVMLYLSTTTSVLPPTSLNVPLVTQFLTMLSLISVLSVVATVITVLVHNHNEAQKDADAKIRSVIRAFKNGGAASPSKSEEVKKSNREVGAFWRGKTARKITPGDRSDSNSSFAKEPIVPDVCVDGLKVPAEVMNDKESTVTDILVISPAATGDKATQDFPQDRTPPQQTISTPHKDIGDSINSKKEEGFVFFVLNYLDRIFLVTFMTSWILVVVIHMALLFS